MNKEKELVVTLMRGLQASGKSTWAEEQVGDGRTIRISLDDLRKMFDNTYWQKDVKIRKRTEPFVLAMRNAMILEALDMGRNVIVDAMHLSPKHIEGVKQLVGDKATVVMKSFMDVPIAVCIERDLARARSVGEKVIRACYRDYLKANGLEVEVPVIEYNPNLPDCIIVDIDGTVANNNWRSPFDTSHCDEDGEYATIVSLALRETNKNVALYFVSGREGHAEAATRRWLEKYQIAYDGLYMRAIGDHRGDFIIKEEIYRREFEGKFNVLYVLDDRNQTVNMWRSIGLTCLQVAPGDF